MRSHHHDHSTSSPLDSLSLASTINPTFGYFTAAAPFARPRNTVQQRCFTARLLSSAFADIVAFVLFCFGLFLMSACLCGVSALKLADCKMLVSNSNFFLSLFIFSALNSWLLLVLECFVAAASKKNLTDYLQVVSPGDNIWWPQLGNEHLVFTPLVVWWWGVLKLPSLLQVWTLGSLWFCLTQWGCQVRIPFQHCTICNLSWSFIAVFEIE